MSISSTFYVRISRTNVVFLVTFLLCKKFVQKIRVFNVDEIETSRSQRLADGDSENIMTHDLMMTHQYYILHAHDGIHTSPSSFLIVES